MNAATRKVAIITGASAGIGKASAIALLEAGWHVTFAGRRAEMLDKAIAESGEHAARALAVPSDVTDPESVRDLFAARWRSSAASTLFSTMPESTRRAFRSRT